MNTLLTLTLALGADPAPAAALHAPDPVAHLGAVKAGAPLRHTFTLAHRGPAGTATVTKVEAGCGCFRQVLTASVLRPGESARLTLDVNTLTQPEGPNRWFVRVGYRLDGAGGAAGAGEVTLQLTADVTREVGVSPPQLAFSAAGAASQTVVVTDRRAKPLTVVQAGASSPALAVEVGPPAAGADGARTQQLVVRLAADAPAGHREELVTVLTDDPAYPELRLPVRVLKRAAGAVAAAPEAVAVRLGPGQPEVSTLVQLRSPDGKPVAVAAAEADHPAVAVRYSPGAGPVATLRVTVTGPADGPPGAAAVKVKLAEPAGQEVIVPVSWTGGPARK